MSLLEKRKMKKLIVTIVLAVLSISGCATSKISSAPTASQVKHGVEVIALAPGGGLIADAVGVELANRGFTIIDPSSTSSMMLRLNLNEIEITRPEGLAKLRDQGIDAFLTVRGSGGYDQQPQSASAVQKGTDHGFLLSARLY